MTLIFAILRFVHIIAEILWAGGTLAMNFFIAPTIGATGDVGKQFAGHLMGKTRFTPYMMIAGGTAVLAGSLLYGIDSNWFRSAWMMTPTGIGFGIGATSGILGFIFGIMFGNANMALAALGAQIQGKPTPEQMSAIQALQKRQAMAAKGNMIFILIAMVLMESSRFFK